MPEQPWEQFSQSPLEPARLRHERGREGLAKIESLLADFAALHSGELGPEHLPLAYSDPDTGDWTPLPFYASPPLAVVFEVSEMIYNLKVALDYATYALFEEALAKGVISPSMFKSADDFRKFEKSVQFPIRDSPESFASWARKHGKWLGDKGALFELLQPYRRPLTRFLGDSYHNLDKHRGLQELSVEIDLTDAVIKVREELSTSKVFPGIEWAGLKVYGFETKEPFPPDRPMGVYGNASVEVFLPGRHPLVPTLKILKAEVRALIDTLESAL